MKKFEGHYMQLQALGPLLKFRYTFVSKNLSSCRLEFPGKNCRQIYGNLEKFKHSPLLCTLSLQFIFFSEQPFYGNCSTLDSQANTVTSHAFAYSLRWRRKP